MALYSIMSLVNFVIGESKLKCVEGETHRYNDDLIRLLSFHENGKQLRKIDTIYNLKHIQGFVSLMQVYIIFLFMRNNLRRLATYCKEVITVSYLFLSSVHSLGILAT
jgi:hypothetical protein